MSSKSRKSRSMIKKYELLRPRVAAAQAMAGAPSYVRQGSIEVRLARSSREIRQAQKLRYQIFYREMSARPDFKMRALRRDIDPYDSVCDHLLVLDHDRPKAQRIVGTYRLLRQEVAEAHEGFYSEGEFDLASLRGTNFKTQMGNGQLLELGRSCVHPDYRANSTINMLWKGIAEYLKQHGIGYMFGCASFPSVDPQEISEALSYLYHHHRVPDDFRVSALENQFVPMDTIDADDIDVRRARRALPPLIKGYLRLGCFIGDGAVIDHQFGTTDVFILLPVEKIASRYLKHYEMTGSDAPANDAAVSDGDMAVNA